LKVAVAGLWHLGTVTAACLASWGHDVIAFDESSETVSNLRQGRPPVLEPGLAEMISAAVAQQRLVFTDDPKDLGRVEVLWICYDTPVDENDVADVDFVLQRVIKLLPQLSNGAMVLISSQLPVGTTARLESSYRTMARPEHLSFAYVPENLRLGKAIEVFTHPDRIVAGVRSRVDRERIASLLSSSAERIEWMAVESAEMTKHALNAFLATSVVFINEIATLCEQTGADALEVERGLKSDVRIGKGAYLHPGAAFAGGTLARDVSFLLDLAGRKKIAASLLSGVQQSNRAHQDWIRHRLIDSLGSVSSKTIGVLGLTYKPGTNTLRRSSAVELCRWLNEQGAAVQAFDPAVESLPFSLAPVIRLADSVEAALDHADAAIIATAWPEFLALSAATVLATMHCAIVLDPARHLQSALGRDPRIRYFAVGRSPTEALPSATAE